MSWNTCSYPECEAYTARPDGQWCESHRRLILKQEQDEKKATEKRKALLLKPMNIKVKELKDSNLWVPFSKYIRLRDSDDNGLCTCFTCGLKIQWDSGMQAGHFIGRRHWATRYHLKNVHAQCPNCNMYQSGMQYEYSIRLDAKYGEGTAKELYQLSLTIVKFTQKEIDDSAAHYRALVKNELSRLSLKEPTV